MKINIVLHEPEIPANTGNIGRTCVATGAALHLIEPIGFHLTEKNIKRAGMDYWDELELYRYMNYEDFLEKNELQFMSTARAPATPGRVPSNFPSGNPTMSGAKRRMPGADKNDHPKVYFATTKGRQRYDEVNYKLGDFIMFGKESAGIPEELLIEHPECCIRIPMLPDTRSLNLSNSVAIVLYEALRQNGFQGFETEGELHRLKWEG